MNPDFCDGGFFDPANPSHTDDDGPDDGLPIHLPIRQDAAADEMYRLMCEPDGDAEGDF